MNDLAEYFSDKERIKELEVELELMTVKLKNEQDYKRNWRRKYKNLAGKMILTRGQKALALIKELRTTDKPTKLIRAIAKTCFLSEVYVHELWYKS